MKLNVLKRTAAIGALGLFALLGTGEIANAQTYRDYRDYERAQRRAQRQYERQQTQYYRQQQRAYNQRYRVYSSGRYYQTDERGVELLRQAVNRGYQQGFRAGQADRGYRRGYNYGGLSMYRSGNYGYQSYVDSSQYRYYFQQGFQRGYEDGYYSRNRYGYNSNGGLNILGNILSGILNISSY
ncbi:MAG TPA: hypothetical protein VF721_18975 [Pyrinomonadaceae bacterium]|jgi:type II secretory pathway pseudopilin PulG